MSEAKNLRTILKMRVEQIQDHTPSVRELHLKPLHADGFSFKAGQFVMLHVPQPEKPALRAYSIASSDQIKDGFILLFKFVQGGLASQFVWSLNGKEILDFTGPFGRVFFKEPVSDQIVFLNTGTGLSQHYSFLTSKKDLLRNKKIHLYFGVRNEAEIYYEQQLKALQQELPDFHYHFVLSRPSEAWSGKKGYIQNFLPEVDYHGLDTTFYLCGNGGMIKEVKERLINQENIDKAKILAEAFD
jgi:CDP-4-dehydro-6-deoxyglucose reductase